LVGSVTAGSVWTLLEGCGVVSGASAAIAGMRPRRVAMARIAAAVTALIEVSFRVWL
jgi:hypothetical protein